MITFTFDPLWKRFNARKQQRVIRSWLASVGRSTRQEFTRGAKGRHTGVVAYRKGGGRFRRSAGDGSEYPAIDSGALLKSLRTRLRADSVTTGTDEPYARWLRTGTEHMARRRMTDTALKTAGPEEAHRSRGWVAWNKGR